LLMPDTSRLKRMLRRLRKQCVVSSNQPRYKIDAKDPAIRACTDDQRCSGGCSEITSQSALWSFDWIAGNYFNASRASSNKGRRILLEANRRARLSPANQLSLANSSSRCFTASCKMASTF
jgi:hypothetical protein